MSSLRILFLGGSGVISTACVRAAVATTSPSSIAAAAPGLFPRASVS